MRSTKMTGLQVPTYMSRLRPFFEAISLVRESTGLRVRKYELAFKLLALTASCVAPASALIPLKLPLQLWAYCPPKLVPEVWRNCLHVFYRLDYEHLRGFRPKEGWRVIDLGAFIGLYTLRAARLVRSRGVVISVEPLPENLRLLDLNVSVNSLRNVRLLAGCAWTSWGEAVMYIPSSPVNATLSREYAKAVGGPVRAVKVMCMPLDAMIERAGRVDLLKVDVEGAELALLEGSSRVKPELVKRVVVEVHTDVVKPHEVADALEERGYWTVIHLPEESPLQAFVYAL